ncbi:MAG: heavy metal translocating P-type ATPase [Planctomycetota bacterium]|jgi:Cu2+-exporting ATPase|nr:heavy metal translocating P-type ATPase [Planctomycetota bacterium]
MKYEILHDIPGRLRLRCLDLAPTRRVADAVSALLSPQEGVVSVFLSPRTGNLLVIYSFGRTSREQVLALVGALTPDDWEGLEGEIQPRPPPLFETAFAAGLETAFNSLLRWLFLPAPVRFALNVWRAFPRLVRGLASLLSPRFDIALLDASALAIMILRRDSSAMRTLLLLFSAADSLEEWTREESRAGLADSLALKFDFAWVKTPGGEIRKRVADLREGDLVVVRAGAAIPVDGVAVAGEALVNQSTLTGESVPAPKRAGLSVFAGTVVEEGALTIRTDKPAEQTRLREIVRFIEESESLKAEVQSRAERLAESIVPYSLFLSLAVFAVSRDSARAAALLMVDYSCAIRLSSSMTIIAAIREGVGHGVLLKGGKYVEDAALVDCLALDKTGTLTLATPAVAGIRAFAGWGEEEALRTAACIEEHFPHPVARAVVREAERRRLRHREKHAEPEYIMAHGVASRLEGRDVLVGSAHFVLDDMGAEASAEAVEAARSEALLGRSILYLAVGGRVAGIIAIEDPVRPDAAGALAALAADGIGKIVILTGDGERTALAVTESLGLEAPRAELLPADKARIIREFREAGRRVMFVGDGVNDSPALSAANVGVSLKGGSDLAREVCGVLLLDGSLAGLLAARRLSRAALVRIDRQFWFIVGLNSLLLACGLYGGISPRFAAFFHNLGTLAVTANSIRRLLPEPEPRARSAASPPP